MLSSPRLLLLLSLSMGALAGWLAAGLVPASLRGPFLHEQDIKVSRPAEQPLEITPAKWFFEPFLIGDFDLQFDIELAEGAELDVLLRQVEPRRVGEELLPFHGRFSVLRLSTTREGPGFRTREQALLGPDVGGVQVSSGITSTVWIEGRGRHLTANVAGKKLPVAKADDEYGMLTLLVRGGKAVLHRFELTNRGLGSPWVWSPTFWSVFGAVLAALACAGVPSARRARFALGMVAAPGVAWLATRGIDTQLGLPEPVAILSFLALSFAVAVLSLGNLRWRVLVVALAAGLPWLGHHLLARDDRAVDAVFGPAAGSQLSEALARLVRGPTGLSDLGQTGQRVFLLGGQLLYDRGEPDDHLELKLRTWLSGRRGQPVDVLCLPTVDGHAAQQWELFRRHFTDYRPRVLVLGVGRDDAAPDPATGVPRSSSARLRDTVRELRAWCAANECKPVLWYERALDDASIAVLKEAEAAGVPVGVVYPDTNPVAVGKMLTELVETQLP